MPMQHDEPRGKRHYPTKRATGQPALWDPATRREMLIDEREDQAYAERCIESSRMLLASLRAAGIRY